MGAWYWWDVHGVIKFKTKIEELASQQLQGQVKIKILSAPISWPLEIQLSGLQIDSKKYGIQGSIDRISASLDIKSFSFKEKKLFPEIKFKIKKAQLIFQKIPSTASIPAPAPAKNSPSYPLPQNLSEIKSRVPQLKDLSFIFTISDTQFEIHADESEAFRFNNWNTRIEMENLTSPIRFSQTFNTILQMGQVSVSTPVSIEGQTELKNGQFDLLGFRTKFLNIESLISGHFNLNTKGFQIQSRTMTPDLAKIPLNIPEFPLKSWSGSLSFDVRAIQENSKAPLYISGAFQLKDFQAQLNYSNGLEKDLVAADGPLKAFCVGQFQFARGASSLFYFPTLSWKLDLKETQIRFKELFFKHVGVNLSSEGELSWNQVTQIKKANLKFYSLNANVAGTFDPKQNSNLAFDFSTPSLLGFESFFPMLSSSPLSGSLQGQVFVSGPLQDYKNLKIDLKKLELSQGRGKVSLKNETNEVEGPFLVDVKASGVINKMEVEQGQVSVKSQLSGMAIKIKDLFKKSAGDLLSLDMNAQKNNKKLEIKQGLLSLAAGKIQFHGTPPLAPEEAFDMNIQAINLNLQKLSESFPLLGKFIKSGTYQARLAIKGKLNLKDIFQSPLSVVGTQDLSLPAFTFISQASPTPIEKSQAVVAPSAPKAFINDGLLIQGIDVSTRLSLNEFNFNNLKISGIQTLARVKNKTLSVAGDVHSVFGGKVKINSIFIPLTTDDPQISYNIGIQNLQSEPALFWISEKTKDLMKGEMNLEVQGQTLMPGSPQFLARLNARGKFSMKDGLLNTLPFEKMAKDGLSKIPGLGQIKSSPGPLRTNLSSDFSLIKSILDIKNLLAITPRKEEMRLDGKIGLDMNADLSGQVALVDAPVSGSFFEANMDSQKRLVVPIRVTGNLLKPQLSFAEETLKAMMQKTIDYEKRKLGKAAQAGIEKAKKQGEDQLRKEADKKAKEIKDQLGKGLEKGLQDLLGR